MYERSGSEVLMCKAEDDVLSLMCVMYSVGTEGNGNARNDVELLHVEQ